jgi:hypothetical protein
MEIDTYVRGLMEIHREATKVLGKHKKRGSFLHTNHARKKCREIEEQMMKFIPNNIIKDQLWREA